MSFPEYYLATLAILAAYTPLFSLNPILLVLAAILILQIVCKNKVTGLLIASIFLLINLYMLAALISEFNEFPVFNADAKQLLFVGLSLWVLNLLAGLIMIYKYAKASLAVVPNQELEPPEG